MEIAGGKLDYLINNAGYGSFACTYHGYFRGQYEKANLDVNVFALYRRDPSFSSSCCVKGARRLSICAPSPPTRLAGKRTQGGLQRDQSRRGESQGDDES